MIHLQDICKIYETSSNKQVHALDNVNLTIQAGEFTAIVGPSGSGKSTLMNVIGLLDQPSSGSYTLDGKLVSQLTVDELASIRNKQIGFVFQSFHLLPRTSAIENVELPLVYSDRSDLRSAAQQALTAVGLQDRMSHHPSELSGGEQQRVAIARALVNEPDVILADEPTGNLDTHAGLEIMTIFKKLNDQGKTIILVTHDLQLAQHTQRVIRLTDGRVVSDDEVEVSRNSENMLRDLSGQDE